MNSSTATALSERERDIRRALRDDLAHYAAKCLKIRTRTGEIRPLVFNRCQRHVHERFEQQRAETGRVRAIVLKARQPGISTYVAARFFQRATHRRGQRVFILTHEQEATDNLFGFVERFHQHLPPLVRPSTGASSAKELAFDRLDSDYKVATAGTKGAGRSQTIQLFHGSEVGFWPHAESHAAGALQAVPDMPGTEIVLESTANGMGNFFHQAWQQAEVGGSPFQAIFVPWYWVDEYRVAAPEGFRMNLEEIEIAEGLGLELDQMAWRRAKIAEMKDETAFKQEYPATATEAFQLSGHDSFIKPRLIALARAASLEGRGPLILGVDPSRGGGARFSIARRRGRKVLKVESRTNITDTGQGVGWVKQVIEAEHPKRVFVDVGFDPGIGDLLRDWYGAEMIRLVNFGSDPLEPSPLDDKKGGGPKNRRAEMWLNSRNWLEDPGGADIPDSDALQADACGPGYKFDTYSRLVLESKEDMRKRGIRSPDEWDAVALTFAEPVAVEKKPFREVGSAAGGDPAVGY